MYSVTVLRATACQHYTSVYILQSRTTDTKGNFFLKAYLKYTYSIDDWFVYKYLHVVLQTCGNRDQKKLKTIFNCTETKTSTTYMQVDPTE